MDRYAVFGNPIKHSKSPQIHSLFAEQCAQAMHYDKLEVPLDDFAVFTKEFFAAADNKGANVTVPFKEQAHALCAQLSERARLAGAVNTLFCNDAGELCGDNTDGIGLVYDLQHNHQVSLAGKSILLVGAGGAVRGVLQPILAAGPKRVVVCNRTAAKVDALLALFPDESRLAKSSFSALDESFDVIINGTSASLSGALPALPEQVVASHSVSYDMMYGAEQTPFNRWAQDLGAAKVIDGLGMLIEQAAAAFEIWRGVRPDTGPVIEAMRPR